MISLIMAGGRASRLGGIEKPLLRICGKVVIDVVIDVAKNFSREVYVAVSPHTRKVKEWVSRRGDVYVVETPGQGYSKDIEYSLNIIGRFPVLTLPADMPFITVEVVRDFLEKALKSRKQVVTLMVRNCNMLREGPRGIALFKSVGGDWEDIPLCAYPDLLDIDTWSDVLEAEHVCGEDMAVFEGMRDLK